MDGQEASGEIRVVFLGPKGSYSNQVGRPSATLLAVCALKKTSFSCRGGLAWVFGYCGRSDSFHVVHLMVRSALVVRPARDLFYLSEGPAHLPMSKSAKVLHEESTHAATMRPKPSRATFSPKACTH